MPLPITACGASAHAVEALQKTNRAAITRGLPVSANPMPERAGEGRAQEITPRSKPRGYARGWGRNLHTPVGITTAPSSGPIRPPGARKASAPERRDGHPGWQARRGPSRGPREGEGPFDSYRLTGPAPRTFPRTPGTLLAAVARFPTERKRERRANTAWGHVVRYAFVFNDLRALKAACSERSCARPFGCLKCCFKQPNGPPPCGSGDPSNATVPKGLPGVTSHSGVRSHAGVTAPSGVTGRAGGCRHSGGISPARGP